MLKRLQPVWPCASSTLHSSEAQKCDTRANVTRVGGRQMPDSGATATPIEIRVENVSQLFDTLDPFPFPERDLDSDTEEYIVG